MNVLQHIKLVFGLISLFWISLTSIYGQLDTVHYLPPLHSPEVSGAIAKEQVLYISTPSITPIDYQIKDGANNILQAGLVSNASPVSYTMSGTNTAFVANYSQLNTIHSDKGLIVSATDSIYANMRVQGGSSYTQAGSITAKGRSALGNRFRIGHIPNNFAGEKKNASFGILATTNNTLVNFDFTGRGITFAGSGAPVSSAVFSVLLQAGESYVLATYTADDADNLKGMIGGLITSDKPIAVNCGSWCGSASQYDHNQEHG